MPRVERGDDHGGGLSALRISLCTTKKLQLQLQRRDRSGGGEVRAAPEQQPTTPTIPNNGDNPPHLFRLTMIIPAWLGWIFFGVGLCTCIGSCASEGQDPAQDACCARLSARVFALLYSIAFLPLFLSGGFVNVAYTKCPGASFPGYWEEESDIWRSRS